MNNLDFYGTKGGPPICIQYSMVKEQELLCKKIKGTVVLLQVVRVSFNLIDRIFQNVVDFFQRPARHLKQLFYFPR